MPLKLSYGFQFYDLYNQERLSILHKHFLKFWQEKNPKNFAEFFVSNPSEKSSLEQKNFSQYSLPSNSNYSEVLIASACLLQEFLIEFFNAKAAFDELSARHQQFEKVFSARRDYVQRIIAKNFSSENFLPPDFNPKNLLQNIGIAEKEPDLIEAKLAAQILSGENLEKIEQYCVWAMFSNAGKSFHRFGALFILPKKVDKQRLVENSQNFDLNPNRLSFDFRDSGFKKNRLLAEASYCLHCHKQQKDSCRTGIKSVSNEKNEKEQIYSQNSSFKIDELGVELVGCPLDEKISEMNFLASQGKILAALAVAMIDNPLLAATGHRICNDCSKACIFQKQEPVDIPQIETGILKEILGLPFGFEIYSLLTRWNPINFQNPLPSPSSGKKVLVCGLGPAGFTLCHYLLNSGHQVVAIDGLRIEPLPTKLSGRDLYGNFKKDGFEPIKFLDEIYEPLSSRLIAGFGGVMEYGITVRFDKNFLKIIRLLLERRPNFSMFGGIRFGSSITEKIAFETYSFDHVALCLGAGRPHILKIKNGFASGVRLASDFLMSLQLTGAYQEGLFSNLQLRMPVIVIGGGLTAVDTACEAIAYYAVQIKKFANRLQKIGKEKFFSLLSAQEKQVAEEFLSDYQLLSEGYQNFISAKILYRGKLQNSPAYRLNHQELIYAQQNGVEFLENADLEEILTDENGWIKMVRTKDGREFSCRSLLVAIGTSPNISPILEDELEFDLENKHLKSISNQRKELSVICKIDSKNKKAVSFFGDLHPKFEGNVVKAMASAKLGYAQINQALELVQNSSLQPTFAKPSSIQQYQAQNLQKFRDFSKDFLIKIKEINRLSPFVVEVFVHAPLLAYQTKIGQIFRLQNLHSLAKKTSEQVFAMEGVTVTALSVNEKEGLISGIVVETGGSSSLISEFQPGEPCVFMGPSGKPTEIPKNEKVVLIGGGRGNQPLTALAESFSVSGCEVIFFAGYRKNSYPVRLERMQNSCKKLVISISDETAQNGYFQGSVIESIHNFFSKNPQKIDRIFTIGNDSLLHEVAKLRHQSLVPEFAAAKYSISSLNAPMQCMMKGVCGQCLQKKTKKSGEEEYFFACASQDQNSDEFDFEHLKARCQQNSLAEKLSRAWLELLKS